MKKVIVLLTLLSMTFLACIGPKGDTGAPGPQGNANVYSYTFTVFPNQWLANSTSGQPTHYLYVDLAIPYITADVINNGAVLMYLKNGSDIFTIPFSYPSTSTTVFFSDAFFPGYAEPQIQLGNFNTPAVTVDYDIKVVVINGTYRMMHSEVNWKDPKSIEHSLQMNSQY